MKKMVYRVCVLAHGKYINTRMVYDTMVEAQMCASRFRGYGMKDATVVCHSENDPKWEQLVVAAC